jgi:hypothetical protein
MNPLNSTTDSKVLQGNDAKTGSNSSSNKPELSEAEENNQESQNEYDKAKAMLYDIASGARNNPKDFEKTRQSRTDAYSYALIIFLSRHLGVPKNQVVSLCLGFTARQLTNRSVTSQNDVAMLLHGLQFAVQDLAIEARESRALAVSLADQESYIMHPPRS